MKADSTRFKVDSDFDSSEAKTLEEESVNPIVSYVNSFRFLFQVVDISCASLIFHLFLKWFLDVELGAISSVLALTYLIGIPSSIIGLAVFYLFYLVQISCIRGSILKLSLEALRVEESELSRAFRSTALLIAVQMLITPPLLFGLDHWDCMYQGPCKPRFYTCKRHSNLSNWIQSALHRRNRSFPSIK